MIYLQNVANQLPATFTNLPEVTKSYIPAANALIRVDVPIGQVVKQNESKPHLKHARKIGSNYKNPQKRKETNDHEYQIVQEISQEELRDITITRPLRRWNQKILWWTIFFRIMLKLK